VRRDCVNFIEGNARFMGSCADLIAGAAKRCAVSMPGTAEVVR